MPAPLHAALRGRGARGLRVAAVTLASGWLAVLWMAGPLRGELRRGAERELTEVHAQQARGIANLVIGMRDVAVEVARRPVTRVQMEVLAAGEDGRAGAAGSVRAELEAALRQFPGLAGISCHDGRGAVVAQAGSPIPVSPWPVSARLLERAPEVTVLRLGQRAFLGVSAPISGAAGERLGTDVLLYDLAPLQGLLARVPDCAVGGRAVLGSREKDRWWDLSLPPAGDGSNAVAEGSALAAALDASTRGAGLLAPERGSADGQLLAYGRVPGLPWSLVLPVDRGRLYRPADRGVPRAAAPALAAAALLAAAAWWLCGGAGRPEA